MLEIGHLQFFLLQTKYPLIVLCELIEFLAENPGILVTIRSAGEVLPLPAASQDLLTDLVDLVHVPPGGRIVP